MKVVKNINNNVSLCLDSQGREVIAFGKGIGFTKPPYEISLSQIQRTFYDVNTQYLSVIAQLDEDIIELSEDIIDYANKHLENRYSANAIFTLADHIQFAMKRIDDHIHIKLPLYYEVQSLYPAEMEVGIYALSLIEKRFKIKMPREEAVSITFHLVDYRNKIINISKENEESTIERCTNIIEETMNIQINNKEFNYSRYVSHLYYLIDRIHEEKSISSDNYKMFYMLKDEFPNTYECALKIEKEFQWHLNEEELMYLILHINRLCAHGDCNQ